jgi:hypothetical protein
VPRQLLHADAIHLAKKRRYKWWISLNKNGGLMGFN